MFLAQLPKSKNLSFMRSIRSPYGSLAKYPAYSQLKDAIGPDLSRELVHKWEKDYDNSLDSNVKRQRKEGWVNTKIKEAVKSHEESSKAKPRKSIARG